jgi:hypothetical protein
MPFWNISREKTSAEAGSNPQANQIPLNKQVRKATGKHKCLLGYTPRIAVNTGVHT